MAGQTVSAADLGVDGDLLRLIKLDELPVRVSGAIPEINRHLADLLGATEVGAAQFSIQESRQTIFRAWQEGEKESDAWMPLALDKVAIYGRAFARYDETAKRAIMVSDRTEFESSIERFNFRLATFDTGTLLIRFPGNAFFSTPLAAPPSDVTETEKYQNLPVDLQDAVWEQAKALALKRAADSHRSSQ